MTTIYLIRHAEAEGNLYRRIHGWYDALITENGYQQIAALEKRFQDIPVDAVYSSDLFRTMTTAKAVYAPKGLKLKIDPNLREIQLGSWEDCTWGEVKRNQPERFNAFNQSDPTWRAPEGESFWMLEHRIERAIDRIVHAHPGQTVAIFSHGTAIRQMLARVYGTAPQDWRGLPHGDNTAVTKMTWDGERFRVELANDTAHLDPAISTLQRQGWWKKDGKQDVNLWFRPLDMQTEEQTYYNARHEAWVTVHGPDVPFDGDGFVQAAREHCSHTPWGVTCAMAGDELAGIIQLDPQRYSQENAGYIPFCYIMPQRRAQNLGVQLIGQAVTFYRQMGRDHLRLRCASYNDVAQGFYAKYGFRKIGEEQGSRVPLDILDKYIGYNW